MPPPKRPYDDRLSRSDRYDLGGRGGMPQTRTGNREVNTLMGGDVRYTTGSGDFVRDLLFGGGGGGDGGGDGGGGGAPSGQDGELDALIKKILADLDKPLDFNDPLVANILTGARTATLSDLAGRGVYGGYSENQAQQSYINAASSLQDQKQARLLQALGLANQRDLAKAQMTYDQQRYEYENDPARGIGSLIGGGLGAIGGGVAGFFAGGGPASLGTAIPNALQWGGTGAQAGSQIGAGVGGMFAQKPQMSWGNGGGGSQGWGMPPRRNALKQY
jgi:hypothetical protein